MGESVYRQIEEFEKDYNKIFDKGAWEPCDYTMMKDLQKIMYYIEVREAMKQGEEYPGSEYMERSYARGGNSGRGYNRSYDRYMDRGSGGYSMNSGRSYYDDGGNSGRTSGRQYYDDEKEDVIHKLHKAMDGERNPEYKMALQGAIRMLEMK